MSENDSAERPTSSPSSVNRERETQAAGAAKATRVSASSSLISRFAASTAMLAAVIVVAAVLFFVLTDSAIFEGTVASKLRGFSLTLAERIWEEPELAPLVAKRHNVGVVFISPTERFAFAPGGAPIDPEQQLDAHFRYRRVEVRHADGRTIYFFWDMVEFAREHILGLVGLILLFLATIGVTYAFQLTQLRPLRWLRAGVESVARGNLDTRVAVARQDEIGQVAEAFNQMTQRIRRMIDDRERLLGDVSHELRSPLARIRVALELIPEGDKRDAIVRDVQHMESLTTMLLDRERVRARVEGREVDVVDLVPLLRDVVEGFEGQAPGVTLVTHADRAETRADAALLRVLVTNLIENAVKFSLPDSKAVQVRTDSSNGTVELVVTDDGPGVPERDRRRIFEPFVKLDPARGHGKGYGLGLNLCQRIVDAHAGTIEVASPGRRGMQITVRLPAA